MLEVQSGKCGFTTIRKKNIQVENLQEFKIPFNLKPIKSEIYQEEG